jgi:hypothetical protein
MELVMQILLLTERVCTDPKWCRQLITPPASSDEVKEVMKGIKLQVQTI